MKWKKLDQGGVLPVERSSHVIVAVGDKLYLWGGEHEPRKPIDSQIHVYDFGGSSNWAQPEVTGEVPTPRNAPAAAAVGTKIYIFGGRTGIEMGEGSLDELYCFDTATNEWSRVEPQGGGCPPKRSYHAMVAQGEKLYAFGGCGEGGRLNDLWEFDTATNTWTQLPNSDDIKGRGGCGFAAVPGSLYVIGGFTGKEQNDVHKFDLATKRWCCGNEDQASGKTGGANGAEGGGCGGCGASAQASAHLPARSVFALATHGCHSCSHGNHIVVFGGEVEPTDKGHADAGQFSNDVFCFNAQQPVEGWHKLEPEGEMPCPRGWLAATATPAGIVIHGGNANSNERLGDMFLLDMHE